MVFYLAIDGSKTEGLTRFQVMEKIEDGEVEKGTLAWAQGMDRWLPLIEIPEFERAFDPPPEPIESRGGPDRESRVPSRSEPTENSGDGDRKQMAHDKAKPLPWMRLFARGVDLILFFLIFQFALAFFFPGVADAIAKDWEVAASFTVQVVTLSVMILIWSLIEALLLSTWGFTVGKALFQVIVRDGAGELLSFKRALQRALLVWVKGLALMFVWITPIAMMIAHARLMIFGETTWDRDLKIRVTHGRPGQVQMALAIAIYVAFSFMIYKAVQLQLEENRKQDGKEEKGSPDGGEDGKGDASPASPPSFPEDLA